MNLTAAQSEGIRSRIDAAFGDRDVVSMRINPDLGENFYGDSDEPTVDKSTLMALIESALHDWNRPEDEDEAQWADRIVSTILGDII